MIRFARPYLALSLLALYAAVLTGCGPKTPALPPSVTPPPDASEQASHSDHDHPEHGSRGGHMVEMSDGSKIEVTFADDLDMFTVYPTNPDKVSKVEMVTTIDGEEKTYAFEKQPTFDSIVFPLTDPELGTAAKMGDAVNIQLVITYEEEGVLTGKFEHHEH